MVRKYDKEKLWSDLVVVMVAERLLKNRDRDVGLSLPLLAKLDQVSTLRRELMVQWREKEVPAPMKGLE